MALELKELLQVLADVVGKTPDTALYILGGIAIFKIIIYLSTTGSIFYISRLLVNRFFSYKEDGKKKPQEVTDLSGLHMNDSDYVALVILCERYQAKFGSIHSAQKFISCGPSRKIREALIDGLKDKE